MKPILFKADAQDFSTNGIGTLSDAISCLVTEERNGMYECVMKYPVDGMFYDEITYSRILYVKPSDGKDPQPFIIYKIEKPISGVVTVRAEHISYRMTRIPVSPFTAQSCAAALQGLVQHASVGCPFTLWTDIVSTAKFTVEEPTPMRTLLGGKEGSVVDVYGGEWEFDGYTAKLYQNRGADNGVVLRYGKNITDLQQEESIAETYAGIHPFWRNRTDNVVVETNPKIVEAESARNYPYPLVMPVDFSDYWENAPSEEALRDAAREYIQTNNIGIPKVSMKVSFVPLWQTEEYKDIAPLERVRLCDTVTVEFEKLGVKGTAKVVKTVYDALTERYQEITLGDTKSTLRDVVVRTSEENLKDKVPSYSFLEASIDRATKLITGNKGGYVELLADDTTGKPYEIVIMDQPNLNDALKVWRWNVGGLGYSSTGYNGTYRTAITNDGHIVADFMDTGTLVANIIKAGILTDVAGKNYWDMVTGEFKLSSTVKVQKSGTTYQDMDSFISSIIDTDMTQTEVFNRLTDNGTVQGITMYNGQLYINGSYINSGTIASNYIKLYGVMSVYAPGVTPEVIAGHIGAGMQSYYYGGQTIPVSEYGAAIKSPSSSSHVLACESNLILTAPTNGGILVNGTIDLSNSPGFAGFGVDVPIGVTKYMTGDFVIDPSGQAGYRTTLHFWHGLLVGYSNT